MRVNFWGQKGVKIIDVAIFLVLAPPLLAFIGLMWLIEKLSIFLPFLQRVLVHRCPLHALPLQVEWRPVNKPTEKSNNGDLPDDRKYKFPCAYVVCSISDFPGRKAELETVKYCSRCRTEEQLYLKSPLRDAEYDDPRRRFDISSDWEQLSVAGQHPQRKIESDGSKNPFTQNAFIG